MIKDIKVDILKKQIELSSELYMFKQAYQNEGMKKLIQNYEAILEACMSNKTTASTGSYKGNATFSIKKEYQDKEGQTKESNVITFGMTKAKAILAHLEELKKFVEENDKGETQSVDVSQLTAEQQEMVNSFISK